jgi:hypothetical protein
MKLIFWSIKRHGDVSISIVAFADMDPLPDFDEMVAHPGLLVLQKIPFQWMKMQFCLTFPILWRPYLSSSMRHHLSWHTIFRFMKSKLVFRVALHIYLATYNLSKYHPINWTPIYYDIRNDTFFCNSQIILSQNCMYAETDQGR